MVVDHTHVKWAVGSLTTLVVCAIVYSRYPHSDTTSVGGTPLGLVFGSFGFSLMLVAGLLGAREKVPAWRVGRLQTWMRAHLWLSLLSLPILLFHGGFTLGFGLTRVLMVLFIVVTASGILGAVLQNYLPRKMTNDVPLESTYEQIGQISDQLVSEAASMITAASGAYQLTAAFPKPAIDASAAGLTKSPPNAATGLQPEENAVAASLSHYWEQEILPFLQSHKGIVRRKKTYSDVVQAIAKLRILLPVPAQASLDALEEVCEERAQLNRQLRLHHWLHGWLFIHVPLSYALLVLAFVHAVSSLRY